MLAAIGSEPFLMQSFGTPNIRTFGESALRLEVGGTRSLELQVALGRAARALYGHPETIDAVPGLGNLTLFFDPGTNARSALRERMLAAFARAREELLSGIPDPVVIPVHYGGEDGPDLEDVAQAHGLTPDDVVELHVRGEYAVFVMGFAPGFAYLGGLDVALRTARREKPRTHVPAGSVGIGGWMTGVYPNATPGGWNIIGRTDVVMFDPQRNPEALLQLGDTVRFVRA